MAKVVLRLCYVPFPDKNECRQFGVCSQICNNTKGAYKCSCHKYFTKINDTCKADSKYFIGSGLRESSIIYNVLEICNVCATAHIHNDV